MNVIYVGNFIYNLFNMKHFLIDLLAFAALFSSVLVITSKNPVIAVFF